MANPLNLKVGDKVRLTEKGREECRAYFGDSDELVVAEVDFNDTELTYRLKPSCGVLRHWVRTEFILGKVESGSAFHVFKVGDKVRAIDHRPDNYLDLPTWGDSMDAHMGDVGTVIDIIAGKYLRVDFNGYSWNYRPEWLIPYNGPNLSSGIASIREATVTKTEALLGIPKSKPTITQPLPLIETDKLLTIKLE